MAQDTSLLINIHGKLIEIDEPKVMGIINVTPDSFFSGSRKTTMDEALRQAEKMVNDGADFLDIGGYSTRPGAEDINSVEELTRVIPVIEEISARFPSVPLSVDTFRARVAKEAVEHGAAIVNDVSGGNLDPTMFPTIGELKIPYVLMHMRGTPQNMKDLAQYDNLVVEVMNELQEKIIRLQELGVSDIIIDPGFGFAKNIAHNFELLKNLTHFSNFKLPLLIGISRKSMIYKSLGTSPDDALNGTTALHMVALQNGAQILRVHDVKEAKEVIKLYLRTYS
jgi:dihydropteroate synthase